MKRSSMRVTLIASTIVFGLVYSGRAETLAGASSVQACSLAGTCSDEGATRLFLESEPGSIVVERYRPLDALSVGLGESSLVTPTYGLTTANAAPGSFRLSDGPCLHNCGGQNVPEPGSIFLIATALGGIGIKLRRGQQKLSKIVNCA